MAVDAQALANRIAAVIALIAGFVGLWQFLPGWLHDRPLEDGRAQFTTAKVEVKEKGRYFATKSGQSFETYTIRYSYAVAGVEYQGAVNCTHCEELAAIQQGQDIRIRYARDDPGRSRVDALGVDLTVPKVLVFSCVALIVVAAFAFWVGRWDKFRFGKHDET